MNFDQIIKTELGELLFSHRYTIEQSDNLSLNYISSKLRIRFFYDDREYSCGYWIKHINCEHEHENFIVEKFLKLSRIPTFGTNSQERMAVTWAQWIASYFTENKDGFVDGNDLFYKELDDYCNGLSETYHEDITLDFLKDQIQDAWQRKDYRKLANLKINGVNGLSPRELKKIDFSKNKIISNKDGEASLWHRLKEMFKS